MTPKIWLPSDKTTGVKHRALIYFVCGNPGLIEFYTEFLGILRLLVNSRETDTVYDIYGRNLLGFSDDDHDHESGKGLWDLEGQIEGIYDDVAAKRIGLDEENGKPFDFVILMGHSVGSYISVEIFNRHLASPSRAPHLTLRHGFLLFPTLTHIARSPSGLRVTSLRRVVPFLEEALHIIANVLLGIFSVATLSWIIHQVMGFTPATADVTARWLKSRHGIQQSMHLGLAELETICEDRWSEELWTASQDSKTDTPRFFALYAKKDHWVDDGERQGFISRREKAGCGTKIAVDEGNVPHAFCTREGESLLVCVLKLMRDVLTNGRCECRGSEEGRWVD